MTKDSVEVRYGPPLTTWTYHDARDGEVSLSSDAAGLVRIKDDREARAAEAFGLTARPAKAAEPQEG